MNLNQMEQQQHPQAGSVREGRKPPTAGEIEGRRFDGIFHQVLAMRYRTRRDNWVFSKDQKAGSKGSRFAWLNCSGTFPVPQRQKDLV